MTMPKTLSDVAGRDPSGMYDHMAGFHRQLAEASAIGREAALTTSSDGLTSIVALGMGGSAIGAEFASAHLENRLPVPMRVVRGYVVPEYVGPNTLVLASSYSGNTEETLSAFDESLARGARVICVTTGGRLAELAGERGLDVVRIPAGLPPRAALGYSLLPQLWILHKLGLAPDPTREIEEATGVAAELAGLYAVQRDTADNAAKQLAEWFFQQIPVVYGAVPWTGVVASRWCGQISENSKLIGHRNELPEMNHNEIVGWSAARPVGGISRVVFLRDSGEHPRVARRFEVTKRIIDDTGADTREVWSMGESQFARLISLVVLGDFMSYYLAMLTGADPTPVEPIDRLKAALAETGKESS